MKFKLVLSIFICLNIYEIKCQELTQKIISNLKTYEFEKAEELIKDSNLNTSLKNAFLFDLKYLKNGEVDSILIDKIVNAKIEESIVENYTIARYYSLQTSMDSLSFGYLKKAFENAKIRNDTLLINECVNRILSHLFRTKDYNIFRKYLNIGNAYKRDSIDCFWMTYYGIGSKLDTLDVNEFTLTHKNNIEKEFLKGYRFANHPYQVGALKNFQGIYNDVFLVDSAKAKRYYHDAFKKYNSIEYYYGQCKVSNIKNNTAIAEYFRANECDTLRKIILRDIKIKKKLVISEKGIYEMFGYEKIHLCYENLRQYDSAYHYFKKMVSAKDKLNQKKHSREIQAIEAKYNLDEKEEELKKMSKEKNELATENTELESTLYTILPILGGTLLLLIFIFYLYKRYKTKSTILEEEQSETLQRLDELKSIVIKNHIVLKDKTKVYITDLMYIKSDDHYLEIFTQDGKSHTVRGKLSQIKEELPPNFIQCHRSYIVNSNYIKQVNSTSLTLINKEQIPLSRSYKKKFNS